MLLQVGRYLRQLLTARKKKLFRTFCGSWPKVTKPFFFPKFKPLTDQENEDHVKDHRSNKALVGEIVTPIEPPADSENILKCNCAEDYGAMQHENDFI